MTDRPTRKARWIATSGRKTCVTTDLDMAVHLDTLGWDVVEVVAAEGYDRLRDENTWLRNQMGDVRGMQTDGATPEEMDIALGRALAGERARWAFDVSRGASDEEAR